MRGDFYNRLFSGEKGKRILARCPLFIKTFVGWLMSSSLIGFVAKCVFRGFIPSHGLVVDTNCDQVTNRTRASLLWGFYEGAEARFVSQYLPDNRDVIELGGSLGVVSCLIRRHLLVAHQLIIVEANPYLEKMIKRNLKRNTSKENYMVVNRALGYGDSVGFEFGNESTGGRVSSSKKSSAMNVLAVSLSALLHDYSIKDFNLVCDIEGGEIEILRNDAIALDCCQCIIIELHETTIDDQIITVSDLHEEIIALGFELRDKYGNVFVFVRSKITES